MGGEIPREEQSFASTSFRSGLNATIDRIGILIERGVADITLPLDSLEYRLKSWQDDQFREAKAELEIEAGQLEQLSTWVRPRLPSWQRIYYYLLIDLAKRNRLLDIEEDVEMDK